MFYLFIFSSYFHSYYKPNFIFWIGRILFKQHIIFKQANQGKLAVEVSKRNEKGEWIKGCARNCGNRIMGPQRWAYDGQEENVPSLIVELDALAVVHLMKNSNINFSLEPLLTRLQEPIEDLQQSEHVYREANQCTDALARIGSTSVDAYILFINPRWISYVPLKKRECLVTDLFLSNSSIPYLPPKKKKKIYYF